MLMPLVSSRMEKRNNLARGWINAAEVCSLVQIAAMAGQSQIARIVGIGR
jgi:alkylated DNA nucleotide flippase Atl1